MLKELKGTLQRVNSITVRADLKSVKSMTDGFYCFYWGNDFFLALQSVPGKSCMHNELYRKALEVIDLHIIIVIGT